MERQLLSAKRAFFRFLAEMTMQFGGKRAGAREKKRCVMPSSSVHYRVVAISGSSGMFPTKAVA